MSLISWEGRISRSEWWFYHLAFWMGELVVLVVSFGVFGQLALASDSNALTVITIGFYLIASLLIGYIAMTATIKRLHDTDRSGWWVCMAWIPIIGFLYLIVVCGFFKGTVGENRFGKA